MKRKHGDTCHWEDQYRYQVEENMSKEVEEDKSNNWILEYTSAYTQGTADIYRKNETGNSDPRSREQKRNKDGQQEQREQ
jgi:lipoate-protein ligase B